MSILLPIRKFPTRRLVTARPTPCGLSRTPSSRVSRQDHDNSLLNMKPQNTALAFLGILWLLTRMQVRMTNMFNLLCMYRLHNLNMQLALLEFERRRRQRRRQRPRNPNRRWRVPRPNETWFEMHLQNSEIPDHFFKSQLRMKRATFDTLLNQLYPFLLRQDTVLRDCIPPEKVLALGIYRLAHKNSYVQIGATFGVGKSTVVEAVQDVTEALFEVRKKYIKFPVSEAETRACIETFSELCNLPNVVGAIECTHVQIKAPSESAVDYFSRYQQYDFIVQGVVDGRKIFLDFAAGFPGSHHDAQVLINSALYKRAEGKEILNNPTSQISGHEIRPYLVGGSTYPLGPWLQKPFPDSTKDQDEIALNKELTASRVSGERALGVLKDRWKILAKRLDCSMNFAAKTATACAVLHNFCIMNGDEWNERDDDDGDDGNVMQDRDDNDNNTIILQDGDVIRDVLKEYICSL